MIRKREGFTLVELLVVIAIIIILAAILFPIFAKAREKAQQTRCINNLKQMGTAIEMYEDDYEGGIMPISIRITTPGQEAQANSWGSFWQDLANPYLKQLKKGSSGGQASGQGEVFQCPSAPKETATGGTQWQMGKDYGYNPYLKNTVTQTMVKYPSTTLRLTEVGDYVFNCHDTSIDDPQYKGGSWYGPVPNGAVVGYLLNLQAPGWHNGYNDCLWVDGHVSSLTWERVMYTDRWNNTTDPNVWCRLSPKEGFTGEG
jgi:prepilin-type N-terminal cleavage/methylation domain-containing protein/prepilin-type processing-associated H-X9-DG protein